MSSSYAKSKIRLCAVVSCNNTGVHTFPTDETSKRKWIRATRLYVHRKIGLHLRKFSSILLCSDHFTPSDFQIRGDQRILKRTAVPSNFPWFSIPSTSSSSNTVDPENSSHRKLCDKIIFSPSNAIRNYSRPEPIKFVEQCSTIKIEMTGDIDPLCDDDNPGNISESNFPPVHDQGSFVAIIDKSDDQAILDHEINSTQIQKSTCDSSVQRDHISESVLESAPDLPTVPDLGSFMAIIDTSDDQPILDHDINSTQIEISNCDNSVQTDNISESALESVLDLPLVPDQGSYVVVIDSDDQAIIDHEVKSCENQTSYCDSSVQTDLKSESALGSDKSPFSVYNYKHCDKAIRFYTGLQTFKKLMYVFNSLGDCSNLIYFNRTSPNKLDALEQFFITLVMLRRHNEFEEIAMLCLLTVKEATDIFITWIRLMALQWKNMDLWEHRGMVNLCTTKTRLVIVATECPIMKPSLPLPQQVTFSSYKNKNTVKFLTGIAPTGLITYVSPCYGGSVTDRQILEKSNILSIFNRNDEIMVDKGLKIQRIDNPNGIKLIKKTLFKKGNHSNLETTVKHRKAGIRDHVEKIIGMLKEFNILKQPLNQTETVHASDIAFVCAMLVNFRTNKLNHFFLNNHYNL